MARAGVYGGVFLLLHAALAVADEAVWIGPATGAWNVPANWSTGLVPSTNSWVRIDDTPAQDVRVESRAFVNGVAVAIDPGDSLAVIGSIFNGSFFVDGAVSLEGSNAQLNGSVLLNVGGDFRLGGANAVANATSLFNAGLIHGGGRLTLGSGSTSYNNGIVRADVPASTLLLQTPANSNFENRGRLVANGGGKLQIETQNTSFTSFSILGGRIEAYPGSTVVIGSGNAVTYVEDSVLAAIDDVDPLTAAPAFQFNSQLKDVTLEGKLPFSGATFTGFVRNTGEMSPGADRFDPNWHNGISGDVMLTGGGTVNLTGSSQALFGAYRGVSDVPTGNRVTNVDNIIRGSGELLVSWGGFTNRSVVQADSGLPGELVFYNGFSPDGFINTGVMKAINGGKLRLGYASGTSIGVMQNSEDGVAGEILAGENSTVALANIRIVGGLLHPAGGGSGTQGKFQADGTVVFDNLTLKGNIRFQTAAAALSTITFQDKNYNNGVLTGKFAVATNAELLGGGELIGESGNLVTLTTGATFVNGDNLIHGSGAISGGCSSCSTTTRFTNRGTVRADGTISFASEPQLVNRGRLEAGPGGTLNLPVSVNVTVVNSEDGVPGTIHAANGGKVMFTRINGGILSTEGTGVIRASSNGTISDLRNLGTIEATSITAQGTIVNDGLIKGGFQFTSPYLRLDGTGQWQGFGGMTGGTVINGPQHTLLANGDLGSSTKGIFVNEGTMRTGDAAGVTFRLFVLSFENSGLVHAPVDRTFAINSSQSRITNTGTMLVDGNMDVMAAAGLYNDGGGVIDVRGKLDLGTTRLRNRTGGKITGSGEIAGAISGGPLVLNDSTIEPGPGLAVLTIGDDFQQLAGGQLKMDVSGGTSPASDLLRIAGAASLAGALNVSQVGDAAFKSGDSFTLVAATGGVVGQFEQVAMPMLDANLFWYLQYATNEVRAYVADVIPGDFTKDGSVGAEDFVWWRHNGGTPEQYSDWAANFGRVFEVPQTPTPGAVPEPASGLIAVLWAVFAMRICQHR